MPRFNCHSILDHRLDNQVTEKKDLRFHQQDTAEDFATMEYQTDVIPRSVLREAPGLDLFMIVENPEHVQNPNEVFFINSMPGEG